MLYNSTINIISHVIKSRVRSMDTSFESDRERKHGLAH